MLWTIKYRRPTTARVNRRAFTLIELLVVLTIVSLLIAMLIPAVLSARARARIAQCASHQENMAKAMIQYDLNKGSFPGYAGLVPGYQTDATPPVRFEVGWPVLILKLTDHADVWDVFRRYDHSNPLVPDSRIGLFVCPSDTEVGNAGPALSYAVNCGQPDAGSEATVGKHKEYLGLPDEEVPPDWAANGLFFRQHTAANLSPPLDEWIKVKISASDISDGTGHTFLLSESYGDGLADSPDATNTDGKRGSAEWNAKPVGESLFGFTWTQKPQDVVGINWAVSKSDPMVDDITKRQVWMPSCNHPGGVNVVYADGHVKFLDQGVTYRIYALQMTPDGSKVWASGMKKDNLAGKPDDWVYDVLPSD